MASFGYVEVDVKNVIIGGLRACDSISRVTLDDSDVEEEMAVFLSLALPTLPVSLSVIGSVDFQRGRAF